MTGKAADLMASDSDDYTLAETVVHSPKNASAALRRKHPKSLSSPLRKRQQKAPFVWVTFKEQQGLGLS